MDTAGTDDIPAIDWQGRPITAATCAACEHAAAQARGECERGRSCMQDAYARRIDRFFRTHPQLAGRHLRHPYFEVRAIAARHADVFRLTPLLADPDETVRLQVALPVPLLQALADDGDWTVRWEAAGRAFGAVLERLLGDAEPDVRERARERRLELGTAHG
jgi:hypothetical protein